MAGRRQIGLADRTKEHFERLEKWRALSKDEQIRELKERPGKSVKQLKKLTGE